MCITNTPSSWRHLKREVIMKKRILSSLLAMTLVVASITGCGAAAEQAPAAETQTETQAQPEAAPAETTETAAAETAEATSDEPVTLKWALWDVSSTVYYQPLIDAYTAAHPNVTIEMVDLGSTDYSTVLGTQLSGAGSDFDVVTIKDVPGETFMSFLSDQTSGFFSTTRTSSMQQVLTILQTI